jgi:hypothetical protein
VLDCDGIKKGDNPSGRKQPDLCEGYGQSSVNVDGAITDYIEADEGESLVRLDSGLSGEGSRGSVTKSVGQLRHAVAPDGMGHGCIFGRGAQHC